MLTVARICAKASKAHEKGSTKHSKDEQRNMKVKIVRLAALFGIYSIVTDVHQTLQHSCCRVVPPNEDILFFFLLDSFFVPLWVIIGRCGTRCVIVCRKRKGRREGLVVKAGMGEEEIKRYTRMEGGRYTTIVYVDNKCWKEVLSIAA